MRADDPVYLKRHLNHGGTSSDYEMAMVNSDRPEPIHGLVRKAIGSTDVDYGEYETEQFDDDVCVLFADEEPVAVSPIQDVQESILMVNADLYRTGTVGLDNLTVPDVLAELQEETFTLAGFPSRTRRS